MSGLRYSMATRTARIATAGLLAASASMFFASAAMAAVGGNNGTVQINGQAITNGNDPHLTCPITIKWSGFDADPAGNQFTVTMNGVNPTGGTIDVGNGTNTDSNKFTPPGTDYTKVYPLTVSNGAANNKGEYHINISVTTNTANGSDSKSKTVWVQGCTAVNPVQPVTLAGSCNTHSGNYEWTLTAVPHAAVTGTYTPPGGGPTNFTTNAGTGQFSFDTAHNPGPVSFIVAGGAYAAANSPQTATTDAACNAPVVVNPSATASATCNSLSAHLDGGTAGATFAVLHNGVTDNVPVAAGTPQNVSYGSAPGASISVSTGGGPSLASATAPANCGVNPTPPSATATSTCSAASVHLDAGTNTTQFDITEPGGSHQVTVSGGLTQDISYTPAAKATVSVSVGGTQLATATAPANCGAPGQADPAVSAVNHCKSGINLTLSNMNGTADTTFTVTDADGKTHQVPVRAGQIQKVAFAVTEDTTGTVSASAPGLANQTFTYKKNCASVLGIKHTRKLHHKPSVKPVVEAEKSQLPFTGFDTQRALLDGAGLFFLGAVLCGFGARRREQQI